MCPPIEQSTKIARAHERQRQQSGAPKKASSRWHCEQRVRPHGRGQPAYETAPVTGAMDGESIKVDSVKAE
jgi:hypothetical protein